MRIPQLTILLLLVISACSHTENIPEQVRNDGQTLTIKPSYTSTEAIYSVPGSTTKYKLIPNTPTIDLTKIAWDQRNDSTDIAMRTRIAIDFPRRAIKCPDDYTLIDPFGILDNSTEEWTLFSCRNAIYENSYLKLINISGSKEIIITFGEFDWIKGWNTIPDAYYWTRNGSYVYVNATTYNCECTSRSRYLFDGNGLYRIDLHTGEMVTILPYKLSGYAFSISSDETSVTYVDKTEKNILKSEDMTTEIENSIAIPGNIRGVGTLVWSSDDQYLYFSTMNIAENGIEIGISIFEWDIYKSKLREVVKNNENMYIPYPKMVGNQRKYWISDYELLITSILINENVELEVYVLDIRSGDIRKYK